MACLPFLTRTCSWVPRGQFEQKLVLDGWNYLWLDLIFMVLSLLEALKFYYTSKGKKCIRMGITVVKSFILGGTVKILNIGTCMSEQIV